MKEELLSLKSVAANAGVAPHIITYAISRQFIPEPSNLNGRRSFSKQDVANVEKYLLRRLQKKEASKCKTKPS